MFKQCFIGLGLKDAHSSNYNTFQGRAPYIKACYSQNMFRCLGRILHDVFRETMCNFEGHILHDYKYHAFFHFSNTTYCEKGVACARGFIFDTEADMC